MNFEAYEKQGHLAYGALARAVANTLEVAIRTIPGIHLQQVQHRAKRPESLRQKLLNAKALDSGEIEAHAKDLAGCRLVFYTNSDVGQFLQSDVIRDNFVVDWDRTKIHYPVPGGGVNSGLFISNNYVVRFAENRTALAEYSVFTDLWCEIQIQTTLNHAWSEMEHDIVYKMPIPEGFGSSLMQDIKGRMDAIMRNHLLPAGYEFQKVLNDYERLVNGKTLFDRGALEAIAACTDNNALHDLLEKFGADVLLHYDDLQGVQGEIRATLVAVAKAARTFQVTPIRIGEAEFQGHTADEILSQVADILDRIRYLGEEGVEATFVALCELFSDAGSARQQKRLLESARKLARYDLAVWKQSGPVVQELLVERVRRLDKDARQRARRLILEILGQVLRSEINGTTSTHNAISIQTGPIQVSEMLNAVRKSAIGILKELFLSAESSAERNEVIGNLSNAMSPPNRGGYSSKLLKTVLENTNEIVRFYTEVAKDQTHETLQRLEHSFLWLNRRNREMPAKELADPEIATARDELAKSISEFRELINRNRGFVIYKTLVGHQSVFGPAWNDSEFEARGSDAYRAERIRELVGEVSKENAEEWLGILIRCAETESDDLATFPSFGQFLEQLACSKPEIVLGYLDRLSERLSNFLPAILTGLEKCEFGIATDAILRKWIGTAKYLRQIIWYQRFAAKFDLDLFERALSSAIAIDDEQAVLNAAIVCISRNEDPKAGLTDRAFFPAIEYLSKKGNCRWINGGWPMSSSSILIKDLSSVQAGKLLDILIPHPQLDYRTEDLLKLVGIKWPEKIVDFLGARSRLERERSYGETYEAVPYEFYRLQNVLASIPEYLVAQVRLWFDTDGELFSYRSGRLISLAFPELRPEVEVVLKRLLVSGKEKDIEFVIEVIEPYRGNLFTHELYQLIVESLPEDDPLLSDIERCLQATGVVTGEFGFVDAYKQKKEELKDWSTNPNPKVAAFAKRYLLSMDRQIASEQHRGEESLEMRKRDYGE